MQVLLARFWCKRFSEDFLSRRSEKMEQKKRGGACGGGGPTPKSNSEEEEKKKTSSSSSFLFFLKLLGNEPSSLCGGSDNGNIYWRCVFWFLKKQKKQMTWEGEHVRIQKSWKMDQGTGKAPRIHESANELKVRHHQKLMTWISSEFQGMRENPLVNNSYSHLLKYHLSVPHSFSLPPAPIFVFCSFFPRIQDSITKRNWKKKEKTDIAGARKNRVSSWETERKRRQMERIWGNCSVWKRERRANYRLQDEKKTEKIDGFLKVLGGIQIFFFGFF